MAIDSYFFNAVQNNGKFDRVYNAEDVTSYLDKIVGNGVFPTPTNQLQVVAKSGMDVIVKAGQGWINGHKINNTADYPLTIPNSDVVMDRVDNIVFYVDLSARQMGIEVVKGKPAINPVAPTLRRDDIRFEMCLAQISVDKGINTVTNVNIKDTRPDNSLCGWTKGLIDQIESKNLFQQYDQLFYDWFNEVKDDLVKATLIRSYTGTYKTLQRDEKTFNVKQYVPQFAFGLDILEVRINGLTLRQDEFDKVENEITLKTPLSDAGTIIEFVIYKSVDGTNSASVVDQVASLQSLVGATKITDDRGGIKLNVSDTNKNILNEFAKLGQGFHTAYSADNVQGAPSSGVFRYFGHLTTTGYGYIYAMQPNGNIFTNVLDNGIWGKWVSIFEKTPSALWFDNIGAYPTKGLSIQPTKRLSETRNGWQLIFNGYDPNTKTALDSYVQVVQIPKISMKGDKWNGENFIFPLVYNYSQTKISSVLRRLSSIYTTKRDEEYIEINKLIPTYNVKTDMLEVRVNGLALNSDEYSIDEDNHIHFGNRYPEGVKIELVVYTMQAKSEDEKGNYVEEDVLPQTLDTIDTCIKAFQVYDDKLISGSTNDLGKNRYMVLRSIQEY